MGNGISRQAVDLTAYPDLVVIYLGMKVNALRGLRTVLGLGPRIVSACEAKPEGLLHCEQNIIYSVFPFHVGMRWYWRDFESMEAWTRTQPHREWWKAFLRDSGGTGFWHETYCKRGGMEAVFNGLEGSRVGLSAFAPVIPAVGHAFSSRGRLGLAGAAPEPPERMREFDSSR